MVRAMKTRLAIALLAPLTSLHGIERGNTLRVHLIGLVFWTVSLDLFLGAIAATVKL